MLADAIPVLVNSHSIDGVSVGSQESVILVSRYIQAANDPVLCANGNGQAIWRQS